MTTKAEWDRIKWSALSRLPRETLDNPLPFLQKTFAEEGKPAPVISPSNQLTQEYAMLEANEAGLASDTMAIALRNGFDDKLKKGG